MKRISKSLLLGLVLFLVFPYVSFAEISNIVFTTDSQSIKPNELSGAITIQLQDASGSSFQTPETLDIQFISTSPTGQFLNSSGNPATTYMSKNTANKTFYYKDSVEGEFTITFNIRGRDTGIELGASQSITVSTSADPNSSGEVLSASVQSSPSDVASLGITNYVSSQDAKLEVSAGVDRTTSPGSPIWFQANIKKNSSLSGVDFSWSFGDGNVDAGAMVSHTYKYPGDYVVVLNAKARDIFSVSRLKVKVFESSISASDKGEYLEILNSSNSEVNLFNWKIESEGKGFFFQPNTIILPRSSIKLDKGLLKMKGGDNSAGLSIKNGLKEEVFAVAPVKKVDLNNVSKNLDEIKQTALTIKAKLPIPKIENNKAEVMVEKSPEIVKSDSGIIYEVPKQDSFVSKLTNFIKRVFYR